jgi:hypothetical protein
MKRALLLLLLLASVVSLEAQAYRRNIEFGVDVYGGFANSYLSPMDFLQETVTIDLTTLAHDIGSGLSLFTGAGGDVFFNVNSVASSFGWFAGVDATGQFKVPQTLLKLITQGNTENSYSGKFDLGAAAFAETGLWARIKILDDLDITVRPAYFLPLAVMTKVDADYSLNTTGGVVKANGKLNSTVHTPFSTADGIQIDPGDMISKGGGDLTLEAAYALFPNFILGLSLSHIPLFPARLSDGYNITTDFVYEQNVGDILDGLGDGDGFSLEDGLTYSEPLFTSFSGSKQKIFRPVKLGASLLYRPFYERFIVLKPYAALVFNGIYRTAVYFDFGGLVEVNLWNILIIDGSVNFEDLMWRHSLGLIINMRALELNLGVSTQSQSFLKSFQAAGVRVDVGFRLGW